MKVHPIEEESYRILAGRVDLSGWAPGPAAVAARIVHATAEPALVGDLVVSEEAVRAGAEALTAAAPILCDVEMVRAGISAPTAMCALGEVTEGSPTRTAAAMARLAARHPDGAIVVVGCAPTALVEVNRMIGEGVLRPALVVGVPVGFVGAAQSKEDLLEAGTRAGVPVIVLRGERGGAAVAAAAVNALARLAAPRASRTDQAGASGPAGRGCLLIGHGTRSARGADELRRFAQAVADGRPDVETRAGFIEFVEPSLDEALDQLVAAGPTQIVAVPLVLLGAGHMKDDGPAALARARRRHPAVSFSYARDLGVHPDVLSVVADRIAATSAQLPGGAADAVVVVGRGSTDPDANADLAKAARLLADGRGLGGGLPGGAGPGRRDGPDAPPPGESSAGPPLGLVVPAFVSLAEPGVATALDQCARLGARRIAVVPYFLFDGLLVERITRQVAAWSAAHPSCTAVTGPHMGLDPRLVALAWHRYDEAAGGPVHMNCDGCLYRTPLPGYEHRLETPG